MNRIRFVLAGTTVLSLSLVSCSKYRDKTFKEVHTPSFIEKSGIRFLYYSGVKVSNLFSFEHFVEFDGFVLKENNMKSNVWKNEYHISDKSTLSISDDGYLDKIQLGKNICYYITSNEELKNFNYSYSSSVNLSLSKKYRELDSRDMGFFHFQLPNLDFSDEGFISLFEKPTEIIVDFYIDGEIMCKLLDIFPNSNYTPFFVAYGYTQNQIFTDPSFLHVVNWTNDISSSLSKITFNIYPKYQCLSISNSFRSKSWIDDHYSIQFIKGINMETLKWSFYKKDKSSIQYDEGVTVIENE